MRDEARRRAADLQTELVAMTDASAASNADDEHDPEGATIAFERAQLIAVRDSVRAQLDDIDAAISRLEGGTYGRCVTCGRRIDAERLDARPTAARCRGCA